MARGASSMVEAAVLVAAREVFADRGFDGASVDAVAAAAGLTKGAVYSRFPSKEALFVAAALGHDDEVLSEIGGRTTAAWARSWARSLGRRRRWALLGMEFRLYGLRNPAIRARTREWQRESHLRLRQEMEHRLQQAGLRLRVEADDGAALLAAIAAGLAQQHYTDEQVDAERLMATALDLLTQP